MSKTKSGGSKANQGKQTAGKRLGLKLAGGQLIKAGQVIIKQRGSKMLPGINVGMGRDFSLFATKAGYLHFKSARGGKKTAWVEALKD